MGRGAFDPGEIVRVGLNTLDIKLTPSERLQELLDERLQERGIELSDSHLREGLSPGMLKAYLDGTFPHGRAARVIGDQLDLDWATLTLARFLANYPKQVDSKDFFPRDPGLEFQYGIAMRALSARSPEHAKRIEFLSEWLRLGVPAEAVTESLGWFVDTELRRSASGDELIIPDGGYSTAAERVRWLLRKSLRGAGVEPAKKALAAHFDISARQATLIFFGQDRELRTPAWEAVEAVAKSLRFPAARLWLTLASEALPYIQRVRRSGKMTLHGDLALSYELALGLLAGELPQSSPAETERVVETIECQVSDGLRVRFERNDWERPYHDFVHEMEMSG